MTSKTALISLCIFSALLACIPERITTQTDENGVITRIPFHWKSRISEGVLGYGLYHGYVIDGRGVLCVSMRKSPDPNVYAAFYLQLKDVNTGENIWIWDEFYNQQLDRTLFKSIVVNDGKLLLHDRYADYCINTRTGKTIWKRQRSFFSSDGPTNIGNKYFISGISPASVDFKKIDDSVLMGDLDSDHLAEVIKPAYSGEFTSFNGEQTYVGSIYRHLSFLAGTDVMLLIPYDELGPRVRYNNTRSFFGLYNLSEKKWVYHRAPLSIEEDGAAPSLMPVIDRDKVYLTSLNSVGCFEWATGKRAWQYKLTDEHTGFGDMIKVGGKLIVNGHNSFLYCINGDTGGRLWTVKSGSFTSDIYHQDGIIYGIRGDVLRAYDLETGKLLWELKSPDSKEDRHLDSEFNGFVTGIPATANTKGKIFATTNLNLYSFDAIR